MTDHGPRVELRPAYVWWCDNCGQKNYEDGCVPTVQDMELMKQEHGIESWESGHFVVMPESVRCSACGNKFQTEHYEHD